METYETEEQQVEAIKKWWKENHQTVYIGVVMGIAIVVGWSFWQDHKKDQTLQASAEFNQLSKAFDAKQNDSVSKLAERINGQYPGSDYAAYSTFLAAKVKVEQNDMAAAKQLLEKIAASNNKELANIAKIRLLRIMLANKEYEQGLKLVNDIDPAKSESFSAEYDELVGDLYVGLDRLDQARTSYQSALRNGKQSPLLQMKINDLTAPEKLENTK